MSAQRARSAVTADHRSVNPNFPGVPWWGAVLLTATATAVGFAFDAGSGNKELGFAFAAFYVLGCLVAVLAVRQSALFTAVIQPPLILFVAVPGAYFLFNGATFTGVKDTLIDCGYPLIERFPLMFFTSATVLLIGMARWYYGATTRAVTPRPAPESTAKSPKTATTGRVTSKMSAKLAGEPDEDAAKAPRRRHSAERPARAARPAADAPRAARQPARGSAAPSRARHSRPPESELSEPVLDRLRRERASRQSEAPPAEPRRRPRQSTREPRKTPPPTERRSPTEPRSPSERPQRRSRYDDHQPLEPHGTNGPNGTHHPVSRVRYRDADDSDTRAEYRIRRPAHAREPEGWEYDV